MAGFGPPLVDFSPLANLGKTFFDAQDRGIKRERDLEQRQTLANLGQTLASGSPDYMTAASRAFTSGNADLGLGLIKLGEAAKERASERDILQSWSGGSPAAPNAPFAPGAGTPTAAIGNPNEIENRFVGTVKQAGLTNPVGLGAVAAYGKAESGFSPQNVNRAWSDPSESGQAGTAGGIMSWRADRLQNLQNFARQRGEAQPSVETQAMFLAQEDPTLIPKLQAAQTPQEANQIMANAWRFAGYNREGGENARRLALTQQYAQRFGGQGGASVPVPPQVAMTEADVQRLEAQQGNPAIDAQAPVQMAQAPAMPGTPMADRPPQGQGATPIQFAIPGAPVGEQPSILNEPKVKLWSDRLASAPTDRLRTIAKQQLDLAVEDAKRRGSANDPTGDIKEYNFYRQQALAAGKQPDDFTAWVRGNKAAGASNVNVDTKQEGEYAKTVGKSLGERMDAISKEGDSARQDMAVIGQLRQLGGQIRNLGAGAALQSRLAEWGVKVGPNVSEIEAFNALVDKLTPQQRVPGSGASSDLDVKMFKSALPNLIRTPGGNELILSTLEAVAQDKAARAVIADRALTGELKPQDAIKELRALPDPMAGLKEARKTGFKTLPELQQERRPPEPPQAATQFRDGQRARGPNGQVIIFRNGQWGTQ